MYGEGPEGEHVLFEGSQQAAGATGRQWRHGPGTVRLLRQLSRSSARGPWGPKTVTVARVQPWAPMAGTSPRGRSRDKKQRCPQQAGVEGALRETCCSAASEPHWASLVTFSSHDTTELKLRPLPFSFFYFFFLVVSYHPRAH